MPFQTNPVNNYIGKGIVFPIQLNNGTVIISSGIDIIQSSIKIILSWPTFQRFFLNEFGSRLEDLIEEPNDDILSQLINQFVIEAINRWEKRIIVLDVQIQKTNNQVISLFLSYQIVNTQIIDNFVFPFYEKIIY